MRTKQQIDEDINTARDLLEEALRDGDTLHDVQCFYVPIEAERDDVEYDDGWGNPPYMECRGDELPLREFHDGYGGMNGEPVIGFTDRYVYIRTEYDGSEGMTAIPRHPEFVTWIPEV